MSSNLLNESGHVLNVKTHLMATEFILAKDIERNPHPLIKLYQVLQFHIFLNK
jgi:hypothetical protein